MKSAYELAMERLEKEDGPAKKLDDGQKEQIAGLERLSQAQIAEQKMAFEIRIANAMDIDEVNKLRAELTEKIASIEKNRDAEKDNIWNS